MPLLEERITDLILDPIVAKKQGFFRSLPWLLAVYQPAFTYHARLWRVPYTMKGSLVAHRWLYEQDLVRRIADQSLAMVLVRGFVDGKEQILANVERYWQGAEGGRLLVVIDDAANWKLTAGAYRSVDQIKQPKNYESLATRWVEEFRRAMNLPLIGHRSQTILLPVLQWVQSIAGRAPISVADLCDPEFGLLSMLVVYQLMAKRRRPEEIRLAEISRMLTPWFEVPAELNLAVRGANDLLYRLLEQGAPPAFRQIEGTLVTALSAPGTDRRLLQAKRVVQSLALFDSLRT